MNTLQLYLIFISFNVLFLAWQLGHVSGSFTSSPAFADPQDSRTPPSSAEPGFEGPLFSDLSLWILLHDHNLFKGLLKTRLWLGEAQSKLKCVSRKHAWLHGCRASVASLQPCQVVSLIQWKCDLAFPGIINKLVHSPVCPSVFLWNSFASESTYFGSISSQICGMKCTPVFHHISATVIL